MDAKRNLKFSKALFTSNQVSLSRGLKIARLYKRNVSGRVTLLPGTELRPVSFCKRQQNKEAFFEKQSWRAHVSQCFPNIVSSVRFCFQDANYAYATRQGILTKIRACEHLQKFCEHEQASTHLIFASNSSKGQSLRALSNWVGPFDTPNWQLSLKSLLFFSLVKLDLMIK